MFQRLDEISLKAFGKRLVIVLPKLGPAFVKFGQLISTRPDLIGNLLANEMVCLQDKLPQENFKSIKRTMEQQLGIKLEDAFLHIDKVAAAAASIAQVHKVTTKDGKVVAVKVLRKNIKKIFYRNLALLERIAIFLDRHLKSAKRLKFPQIVSMLKHIVDVELNLRFEAAAADKMSSSSNNILYIPKVFWEYSKERILTMEWIDGISLNEFNVIKSTYNGRDIAKNIVFAFFNQAFLDGFFHADLHAGNVLITKDSVVLLDFGITGWLSAKNRRFILEILHGFLERDYDRVAKAHFAAGYVNRDQSLELFALACRGIGEPITGKSLSEMRISQLLTQLFSVSRAFKMETQLELLLLQKNMITVEGIAYSLDNNINMWIILSLWLEGQSSIINKCRLQSHELLHKIDSIISAHQNFITAVSNIANHLQAHQKEIRSIESKPKKSYIIPLCFFIIVMVILYG